VHSLFTTAAVAAFHKQQQQLGAQGNPAYSPGVLRGSAMGLDSFGHDGAPSSVATLQPHPFNVLISEFQQRRAVAALKKGASIDTFLTEFKSQIRELDAQYYQQKQALRD
jgi:hypothetical protein